jgi:hypothetical protein
MCLVDSEGLSYYEVIFEDAFSFILLNLTISDIYSSPINKDVHQPFSAFPLSYSK